MSDQEKHAIIGKLVSDHQAVTEKQNLLRSKLDGIGGTLFEVGDSLKRNDFDGVLFHLNRDSAFPDSGKIKEILIEYKSASEEAMELKKQLASHGIKRDN